MTQDIARERVMHKVLERQAAKYGDRTYMYFEEKEFSFKAMNDAANRVACGLQKLGIAKGDKVAVVMENCPELIFIMFGLSKLGAVEVPINIFHKGDVVNYMVDHSDAGTLIMNNRFIDRLGPVLQKSTKIQQVVVLEGASGNEADKNPDSSSVVDQVRGLGKQGLEWPELVDNDGSYQLADVIWSEPLLMMFTSGTTGLSKGVLVPHNLLIGTAETFANWVLEGKVSENDCIYNPKPLFHAQAWHAGVNLALLTGARMVVAKSFSASKHWDDIRKYGCTYSTAGGAILPILLAAEPKSNDTDNPLKVILGGPASEKMCSMFEPRFGVKIMEYYGSTEAGSPIMNQVSTRKIGSCGNLVPKYSVKIVDDYGVEAEINEPGEILVRPINPYMMMLGYYKMPEKTAEAWKDLWFHTGDCGRIDEDGYLFFVDRKKDALRRRGENVSSFEVERVINSHPAVSESAVYAVDSELIEDDIMVSLVLKPGHSLLPEDLAAFCEERMAYFMVPRYVRFMDDLPKNAVPRVEKYKLRTEGVTPDTWDREKAGYNLKR